MNTSEFIGKQLARLKIGKEYNTTLTQVISTISFILITLSQIGIVLEAWIYVLLIISGVTWFWFCGFYTDRTGIKKHDQTLILKQSIKGNTMLWEEGVLPVLVPAFKEAIKEAIQEVVKEELKK